MYCLALLKELNSDCLRRGLIYEQYSVSYVTGLESPSSSGPESASDKREANRAGGYIPSWSLLYHSINHCPMRKDFSVAPPIWEVCARKAQKKSISVTAKTVAKAKLWSHFSLKKTTHCRQQVLFKKTFFFFNRLFSLSIY